MNVAEILRASAQQVRQGWCQGAYRGGGGVCALGAIERTCLSMGFPQWGIHWADAVAAVAQSLGYYGIAKWNDAPGQTAENVAQGLELAAILFEQQTAQSAVNTLEREHAR